MISTFQKSVLAMSLTAFTLAACNSSGDGSGSLSLDVTDAPIDNASEVTVVFNGVDVQPSSGSRTEIRYDEPKTINLLDLQSGITASLLDGETLPAGNYEWIRLLLDTDDSASYIKINDAQYDLFIPSGEETGLKLVSGFAIPVNGELALTIDFDLRKSIVEPQGGAVASYFLKPALRLVDNSQIGHIGGVVSSNTLTADCSGAVYVYEGSGVVPGDVGGTGVDPITTALVETEQMGETEFAYKVAFLVAGEYTAAFTCDAATDDPEVGDELTFVGTQNVQVEVGATTTANF